MFDNSALQTSGMTTLDVTHPVTKQRKSLDFYVAKTHKQPLLGIDACLDFNLLSVNREHICAVDATINVTREYVLNNYNDLFEGYGKFEGELHMQTDPNVPPVKMPVRRIPVPLRARVEAELRNMCRDGIIAEANDEPTNWISALLVVRKPSAPDKIRICIDPKPLNRALIRNTMYMQTIDDILPILSNAKWFSLCDCKDAYWTVPLDSASSKLTCFDTFCGRYKWLRLPFGVSVASEEFYRRFTDALRNLKGVIVLADDALIYGDGNNIDEAKIDHDRNLIAFLNRCREKTFD
jgi:hypothetical protein